MRARPLVSVLVAAIVAGGCGGDGDGQPRAARAAVPVELSLSGPADLAVVQGDSVEVRGTVVPAGAAVRVRGEPATVTGGGSFSASVSLDPGVNVIDVIATAGGREPAMTALRVTREMPVVVPDLDGKEVPEVQEELATLGLELEVERGGGLFDDFLSGEPAVCEQQPEPGAEVRPGSTVEVLVARRC